MICRGFAICGRQMSHDFHDLPGGILTGVLLEKQAYQYAQVNNFLQFT